MVSGPLAAMAEFRAVLDDKKLIFKDLKTSHAFHSPMMNPILAAFREAVSKVDLSPGKIKIISTVTGNPLMENEATSVDYWTNHITATVDFSTAVGSAPTDSPFLEIGPRGTMATLARSQHKSAMILTSMSRAGDKEKDASQFLQTLGELFTEGHSLRWQALFDGKSINRCSLPLYPFAKDRHWIEFEPVRKNTSEKCLPGKDIAKKVVNEVVEKAPHTAAVQDAQVLSPAMVQPVGPIHNTVAATETGPVTQIVTQQLQLMRAQLAVLQNQRFVVNAEPVETR